MGEKCDIDFGSKKCKPCAGGTLPLDAETAQRYLNSVAGWELVEGVKIKQEFKFADFKQSMDFTNKVAAIAEEEGHHPTILIAYNKVKVVLITHSIGGLSENDFI